MGEICIQLALGFALGFGLAAVVFLLHIAVTERWKL